MATAMAAPSPSSHCQPTTGEAGATIRPISKRDVHRITSGQVVLDLQTAVKELVENALDAGATNIEVRFKDYGAESFEVVDNGTGIDASNYEGIALKHHTSKLSSFSDLAMVHTFGFRGEALSSLCALSEVTIHTATAQDAPIGTILELDHAGSVRASDKKAARQRGTTVTVTGLFRSLPVRRKEFEKNLKREYAKAQTLLQSYALISKGVRWTSSNQPKAGKKTPQFSVNSSSSSNYLVSNVTALFGARLGPTLMALDLSLSFSSARSPTATGGESLQAGGERRAAEGSQDGAIVHDAIVEGCDGASDVETSVRVVGVISRPTHGSGRTSSDRQFFYINGRPWDAGRISRAFNEVYKSYNTNQVPFVVADFRLPTDSYDVNVSPDKRTIFLHEEARLVERIKEKLDELFAPSRGVFRVGGASGTARSAVVQSRLVDFEPVRVAQPWPKAESDKAGEGMDEDAEESESRGADDDVPGDHDAAEPPSVMTDDGSEGPTSADADPASLAAAVNPEQSQSIAAEPVAPDSEHQTHGLDAGLANGSGQAPSSDQDLFLPRSSPSPGQEDTSPKRAYEATLDTTRASWSPVKRSRASPPPASVGVTAAYRSSSPSQVATGRRKRPRTDLIQSLRSYALPGSQVAEVFRTSQPSDSALATSDLVDDARRLEYVEDDGNLDEDESAEGLSSDAASEPEAPVEPASDEPNGRLTESGAHCCHDDGGRDDDNTELAADGGLVTDSEDGAGDLSEDGDVDGGGALSLLSTADVIAVPNKQGEVEATLRLDLDELRQRLSRRRDQRCSPCSAAPANAAACSEVDDAALLNDAGIDNQDADAVEASLNRILHKSDFASMEVIGQFNLGFIIARRRHAASSAASSSNEGPGAMDDLFIVDQHASDEKFNFETLQLETKIQAQRLIQPRALELSASDELVASEHIETLKRNGFEIEVEENGLPGRRVRLVSQPVSRGTVFGVKDLEELLYLLRDLTPSSSASLSVRCSKARAMFASRACRKSVMIGTALKTRQMKRILEHMGEIEQPWNCPHGRPTLRHLACLRSIKQKAPAASRRHAVKKVDWRSMLGG
ncbi:ATP-binding mismatch repair protein [Thecaphora frezii]